MKIYVAARYDRRFELRALHDRLIALGHEPTSQWVNDGEEQKRTRAEAAQMDVDDVRRAELILFIGEPQGSHNPGGGRWFELGIAYTLGMRCVVVLGPKPDPDHPWNKGKKRLDGHETVFTHLPTIELYANLDEAIAAL